MTRRTRYPQVRPATDIVAMENGVQITANMPGVTEHDLQLDYEGNQLHIKACSRCPVPLEDKDVQTLEFGNVDFSLDIIMRHALSAPITTSLDNGVLSVFIPCGLDNADLPVIVR